MFTIYTYTLFKSHMPLNCVTVTPLEIPSQRNSHPIPIPFRVKLNYSKRQRIDSSEN